MRITTEILEGDIIRVFLAYGSTTYRFMVDIDEALEIHGVLGETIFQVRCPGKKYPRDVGIDLDTGEYDMDRRLSRSNDETNVVAFHPSSFKK
jgi:hypothetical protein